MIMHGNYPFTMELAQNYMRLITAKNTISISYIFTFLVNIHSMVSMMQRYNLYSSLYSLASILTYLLTTDSPLFYSPMKVHFVHKNIEEDKFFVLGIFLDVAEGVTNHPFMKPLIDIHMDQGISLIIHIALTFST